MASNWYYEENGDRKGPVDSKTLKQLADNGTVQSTTPVWREGMKDWVKAGSVKGLISSSPTNPTRPPVPNSVIQPSTSPENTEEVTEAGRQETQETIWHRWPIVALLVTCCFPVGLVLVWTHPRWTTLTRCLWTGGFIAVLILGQTISRFEKAAAERKIAEANQLWSDGNQAEAVSIYRHLIDDDILHVSDEARSKLFVRTITFDVENGNESSARELLDLAEMFKVPLTFESPDARRLVATRTEEVEEQRRLNKKVDDVDGSEDKFVQLIAQVALAESAGFSDMNEGQVQANISKWIEGWANTSPELFQERLQSAARQLGAGDNRATSHLLSISPTDSKETTVQGTPTMIVVYGPWSANVTCYFVRKDGRYRLFRADVGERQWSPVGVSGR